MITPRYTLGLGLALAAGLGALSIGTAAAQAAGFADLAAIDRDVSLFTGVAFGQPGGAAQQVDRRLRLAACGSPLTLGWYTPRHDSVVVQCPDAGGWRIYVPVLMSAAGAGNGGAPAVMRGEAVTVTVSGDGFAVSQPGEAMESGPVGAWIRVRTQQVGNKPPEPVRAQIIRPGLVGVPLP